MAEIGYELDLLAKYPRAKRDTAGRAASKTAEDQEIARQFGRDFFDGERRHGYGGYTYTPERWQGVVQDFLNIYEPKSVLDVGCAKGHMLYDFRRFRPKMRLAGIDVSKYAIENSLPAVRKYLRIGSADCLPYEDKEFDLVISINTVHNLDREHCIEALREIDRVGENKFITVDSYKTEEQKQAMFDWNLTALTILSADEWIELFREAGYSGDYAFWMP